MKFSILFSFLIFSKLGFSTESWMPKQEKDTFHHKDYVHIIEGLDAVPTKYQNLFRNLRFMIAGEEKEITRIEIQHSSSNELYCTLSWNGTVYTQKEEDLQFSLVSKITRKKIFTSVSSSRKKIHKNSSEKKFSRFSPEYKETLPNGSSFHLALIHQANSLYSPFKTTRALIENISVRELFSFLAKKCMLRSSL